MRLMRAIDLSIDLLKLKAGPVFDRYVGRRSRLESQLLDDIYIWLLISHENDLPIH